MTQALYSNLGFRQTIEIRKGSTFPIELDLNQPDNETPYDLTGCEIRARVQQVKGDMAAQTTFDFTWVIDAPTTGKARGFLTVQQTDEMLANDARMSTPLYAWACDVKLADGTIVPFCHGDVLVRNGIINWN